MSSWKSSGLFLALALAAAATPAAAEVRVISRSGPSAASYPLGARYPDNHRFRLRQGDRITLLLSSGGRLHMVRRGIWTVASYRAHVLRIRRLNTGRAHH